MTPNSAKFQILNPKPGVDSYGLAEIGQSMGTQQAFMLPTDEENVYRRSSPFCKCRDFLVDSYSYAVAGKAGKIYGWQFTGEKADLSWDRVRLLVRFNSTEAAAQFHQNFLPAIREVEAINSIQPLTEVHETDLANTVAVVGSDYWLKNCLLLSLYTFFPRLACYTVKSGGPEVIGVREWLTELSKQKTSDGTYVASIHPETWDRIISNLAVMETDTFCGFDPKEVGVGTIHHNSGFISVLGWHSEISPSVAVKGAHWKLLRERGLKMHPETEKAA